MYGQGLGLLGCLNALTESNSWHSDHVETEESFYPHPSPISVSASQGRRNIWVNGGQGETVPHSFLAEFPSPFDLNRKNSLDFN